MKPLIVGEAPSKNEVVEQPLQGRVGRRMAALSGLTYEQYIDFFDRVNLLHVRQDTKEKGFEFDFESAQIEARQLVRGFKRGQIVLLLGGRVTEAFGVHHEYFNEVKLNGARCYIVPHPSGVNRWWNDQDNVKKATAFMRGIVERTK